MKFVYLIFLFFSFSRITGAAPLVDLTDSQTGRIEFVSTTPEQVWAMVRGNQARIKPTVVWGDLAIPNTGTKKVPAVIISHGSDGVNNNTAIQGWAKALNDAGIAVFVVDTYSPRGADRLTPEGRLNQNLAAHISDALHALKLLATHPQIDRDKIFHLGASTGGTTVMGAAFPAYMRTVVSAPTKWAGSIALYPGCNTRWRVEQLGTNPAPLMLMLGAKDDMTPAQVCVDFAKSLKAGGHDVSYKVYEDAHHVFDRLNQPYQQFKEGNFAKCNLEVVIDRQSIDGFSQGGYDFVQQKKITNATDLAASLKDCQRMSFITVRSNSKAREEVMQDVLVFIQNN